MRDRAADFGGGVVDTLADRARDVGGLAYEAFTSDPNIGRMTTAEYAQAADRPTPRLNQAAQDLGTIGKAIVTQPVQTGKALVQGEVERARQAMTSPRAAGEYAGSMVDPMRIAAALRKTAPIAELDVYHGTPHRFEPTEENPLGEFDASKIGTGEGAQAYGHGVYLAESPGVAEMYQKTVKNSAIANKPDTPEFLAEYAIKRWQSPEKALKNLEIERNNFKTPLNDTERKQYDEALELLRRGEVTQGYRYKADLPDQMIDRMLDWDKPLSEQPEAVKKLFPSLDEAKAIDAELEHLGKIALADEDNLLKQKAWDALYESPRYKLAEFVINEGKTEFKEKLATGKDLYKAISGRNDKIASERLRSLGIPGIRYLDAGSRDGGTGTRNFVVFPGEEKKVKILKRD